MTFKRKKTKAENNFALVFYCNITSDWHLTWAVKIRYNHLFYVVT